MKFPAQRILCLLVFSTTVCVSASNIDPLKPYAYSANAGWINSYADGTNGLTTYDAYCSGYAYSANFGWIHFGDGTPQNGYAYSNDSESDFGVNIDPEGNLSGYAYAANVGWISFSWANNNDANRPRINLTTGEFSGYAYGANIGWVLLGTSELTTTSLKTVDTDADTISDAWEYQTWGNLSQSDANNDSDADGATDLAEYRAGTAANDASSVFRVDNYTQTSALTTSLTFTSVQNRQYRIEWNTDLNNTWQDSDLGTFSPDIGASTTKLINWPDSYDTRFLRVVVIQPLSAE